MSILALDMPYKVTYIRHTNRTGRIMSSNEPNKKSTTMRLPRDMIDNLDAEATGRGWSRSALVVQVLARFLAESGRRTSVRVVLE